MSTDVPADESGDRVRKSPEQCQGCSFLKSQGGLFLPVTPACGHFLDAGELGRFPTKVLIGLTALYLSLAEKGKCAGFEALVYGPDAYRSQDLVE